MKKNLITCLSMFFFFLNQAFAVNDTLFYTDFTVTSGGNLNLKYASGILPSPFVASDFIKNKSYDTSTPPDGWKNEFSIADPAKMDAKTKLNSLLPYQDPNKVSGNFYLVSTSTQLTESGFLVRADDWYSMGPFNIPAEGATFSFYARSVSPITESFDVYVSKKYHPTYIYETPGLYQYMGSMIDTIYTQKQHYYNIPNMQPAKDTTWTQYTVSLACYAGQSIYIAFHYNSFQGGIINIDDFLLRLANNAGDATNCKTLALEKTEKNNPYQLTQNVPNPFNENTVITYQLPKAADVMIDVYDLTGKKITSIDEGRKPSGPNKSTISATNLNPGMYVYKLNVDGVAAGANRMIVVK